MLYFPNEKPLGAEGAKWFGLAEGVFSLAEGDTIDH
jgi:hypothetical protein